MLGNLVSDFDELVHKLWDPESINFDSKWSDTFDFVSSNIVVELVGHFVLKLSAKES